MIIDQKAHKFNPESWFTALEKFNCNL